MLKKAKLIFLISILFTLILIKTGGTPDNKNTASNSSLAPLADSIADKILRFHVIANSDTDEDQQLKLKVRDAILEYTKPYLEDIDVNDNNSLNDAISILNSHMDDIYDIASRTIKENGYDYTVTATICETYFPVKSYCDIVLPAGNYTALKVIIGNGDGHNWWCVMYPTLCFVDSSLAVLPSESKNDLAAILSDNEYNAIMCEPEEVEITYSCRFFEWIDSIFCD